ncbi:MAG: glycine cleavage system protein GcvH [Parachlamydiaceae bacterium]|nr:glycine cleavage system protein GcvH [Parachlamydiaceae bacterium]
MKYSETHEWIEVKDGIGIVGVTNYAQKELGDIVYVELPQVDKNIIKGQEAVVLESTKAAADVYSPVSGKIIEVNTTLNSTSELVNTSPEAKGWLFKVLLSDVKELDELLEDEAYKAKFL